jgi:SAM-dependent methyltransferase
LAGDFRTPSQLGQEELYPLDLAVCLDCSLVQILNVVDAQVLFADYRYLSSTTRTLTRHFQDYAQLICDRILPMGRGLVVEIGCNDGVLLQPLRELGIEAMGVDAAENVVPIARQKQLDVRQAFFGADIAKEIAGEKGAAAVITASNVFAHIDDLDDVMLGIDELLASDGTFIVEVHYLVDLLNKLQFDTVYHEHLCYYSLHALINLFGRYDFSVTRVERLTMHGGSIRVFTQRSRQARGRQSPVVGQLIELEQDLGITSRRVYDRFREAIHEHRRVLCDTIEARKQEKRTISGYGAAGRATTLLNFCALNRETIEYVVDESPSRVGRYIPGVQIPIVPRSHFARHPTHDCLITAWNYRHEITHKEQRFLDTGGTFVIPLPSVEFIRESDKCKKSA